MARASFAQLIRFNLRPLSAARKPEPATHRRTAAETLPLVPAISFSQLACNAALPSGCVMLQKFVTVPMQVAPATFPFPTTHFAMMPASATASANAQQAPAKRALLLHATMETHVQPAAAIQSRVATTPRWPMAPRVLTGATAPPTTLAKLEYVVVLHVTVERLHKAVW
jgi:hypothetical protein